MDGIELIQPFTDMLVACLVAFNISVIAAVLGFFSMRLLRLALQMFNVQI